MPKRRSGKQGKAKKRRFKFQVFIANRTDKSDLAVSRLREICDAEMPGEYDIQIIDLSRNPELAKEHNIVATPAVFRTLPAPVRKSIGDLAEKHKVLLALDVVSPTKPRATG
jgi:circadian clock protein KaiB